MAILLTVVGLVGLIAMQIVAIEANTTARDTTEATYLADNFINLLHQDATNWTDSGDVSSTTWLNEINNTGADTWVIAYGQEAVNVKGIPKSDLPTQGAGRAKYCVAYKLSWAVADEVLSGFVRVYWPREGGDTAFTDCGAGLSPDPLPEVFDTSSQYGDMVTLPFAVRRMGTDS